MFKKTKVNVTDNNSEDTKVNVNVKGTKEMTKANDKFNEINENKIEKSDRNNEILHKALNRAKKGDFDEDVEKVTNQDLLKVYERFSIREIFSLKEGKTYFKLYKEVFYINDPHKYYFETVDPTVYRRIAAQSEEGDKDWAEAVAKEMNISIIKKA